MTLFAKCIDNTCMENDLSIDKTYKVIEIDTNTIFIENDYGSKVYYNIDRFKISDNVPDYLINEKLNSLKNLLMFLASKQTTSNIEEYEILKNLIDEVEEKFN